MQAPGLVEKWKDLVLGVDVFELVVRFLLSPS